MEWIRKIYRVLTKRHEIYDIEYLSPSRQSFDISIPIERIIKKFDRNKKNIVIIDDSRGIVSVIEDFLKELEKDGINLEDYNILTFYDKYAPFVLKKTLEFLEPISIDFAIIDIVLPGKINNNNKYERMDGIDIAILLNSKYNCRNACFFTGNVVSEHVSYIKDKIQKFENYFDNNIVDNIIFKGDNDGAETIESFRKLLSEEAFTLVGK